MNDFVQNVDSFVKPTGMFGPWSNAAVTSVSQSPFLFTVSSGGLHESGESSHYYWGSRAIVVSFTVFSQTTATDIVASKYEAYAMMGIIVNNPQFKKELAAAKAETRAALGLVSSN
jgi:hypothetical protein